MNPKVIVLLAGVGAIHLVAGALFIAGGCTQEDPPMPPGIYVPKQSVHDVPAHTSPSVGQEEYSPAAPAPIAEPVPAPAQTSAAPAEPAPVASVVTAPAPEPRGERVYVVVKNDSLWLIARKNGMTIEELASYNGLSPKTKVRIGQKLHIPPTGKKGAAKPAPHSKGKAAKPAAQNSKQKTAAPARKNASKASAKLPPDGIYTVKEYDNFSTIAKRFGIRVSDIIAANPGVDSSRLKIGQKLRLTADAPAVPKAKASAKKAKSKAKANAKAKGKDKSKAKAKAKAKQAKAAQPAKADKAAASEPAPAAAEPAPEKKAETSADDPEALLNSVKQPQENAAPETKTEPAAAPQANAASKDKDRLVKGSNGKLSVVIGEDITLAKFCKKFTVSEYVIRSQNQNLPSDGILKAGTSILLIADDDLI